MKQFKLYVIGIVGIIFIVFEFKLTQSSILRFTKIECLEFDKPFADFKKCYLKALARNKISFNLHVRLHQTPVTNVSVNAVLLSKGYTQIYRPHLYNNTFDYCKFLKHKDQFMFWKIIYTIVSKNSNMNHTCPFDHDIIVRNLILDVGMLKMIPFPAGDYQLRVRTAAYNHYKTEIRANLEIKE